MIWRVLVIWLTSLFFASIGYAADTSRTRADLLNNLFQDGQAPGSITPQDMRDLIVSTYPGNTVSASAYPGADMCAKIVAAAVDASSLYPTGATIDATGFTGAQNCAGGMFTGWPTAPGKNYNVVLGGDVLITASKATRVPEYTLLTCTAGASNAANSTGCIIRPKHGSWETTPLTVNATGCSGTTMNFASTAALSAMSQGGVGFSITGTGIPTNAGPVMVVSTTGTTVTTTATVTCANTNVITFTAPVVALGNSVAITFRSKVENVSATCIDDTGVEVAAGSIGMQNVQAQEQSWWRNTYVGICQYQYIVESLGTASSDAQNSGPYRDMHAQSPSALVDRTFFRCITVGGPASLLTLTNEFSNISCDGGNATGTAAILIDAAGVRMRNGNIENSATGIIIGSRKTAHAINISNITCGTGTTTNCVQLSATQGSDTVLLDAITGPGGGTNVIKDDQTNGCTITTTNLGSTFAGVQYFRGGNNVIWSPSGGGCAPMHVGPAVAFASLPTCNAGAEGRMWAVNNSNTVVFNAAVAAGGSGHVIAYCDGTSWKVH